MQTVCDSTVRIIISDILLLLGDLDNVRVPADHEGDGHEHAGGHVDGGVDT